MAYRAGVVGGIRVHRGRAAAAAGRAPRDRRGARHRGSNAGATRRRRCTRRWRSRTRACEYVPFAPGRPRRARRRVPARSRTASRSSSPRSWSTDGRARRRPRRRLPAARRRVRAVVRRARTRRPSCSTGSRSGCPSCSATTIAAPTARRVAGLLPDRGDARARAAARRGPRRADGHRRRRDVGRVGRGPRPVDARATSPRSTRASAPTALLTHRHTAEMELALEHASRARTVQVLFTPHLVPMARGILATCHARPARRRADDRVAARDATASFYAGEPFVERRRRAAADQGDDRWQRVPRHRPLRRAHRHGPGDRARSTTW